MSRPNVNFRDMVSDMMHEVNNGLNVRDDLKHLDVPALQALQVASTFPLHALFFNTTGDLNIGAMVRTATLSGLRKAWVFGRRKFDRRGLVGANNYIEIEQVDGFIDDTVEYSIDKLTTILDDNKLFPIVAEAGGLNLPDVDWDFHIGRNLDRGFIPCVIMGNEGKGFPDHILSMLSERGIVVSIPQRGVMRSLNVGHAFSAITWDIRRGMGWW